MDANISAILYLVSGVFFIMALRGLSSPETSRQGNYFGIAGMIIAVVVTFLSIGNFSTSLIFVVIFLVIVWPLLWENTLTSFLSYFEILDRYFNSKVFFLGNFYRSDLLPYTYLPIWILISTPILHLLLFGFSFYFAALYSRFGTTAVKAGPRQC